MSGRRECLGDVIDVLAGTVIRITVGLMFHVSGLAVVVPLIGLVNEELESARKRVILAKLLEEFADLRSEDWMRHGNPH
jgi:hypothetical protein